MTIRVALHALAHDRFGRDRAADPPEICSVAVVAVRKCHNSRCSAMRSAIHRMAAPVHPAEECLRLFDRRLVPGLLGFLQLLVELVAHAREEARRPARSVSSSSGAS